jgi:hypothetical protein
MVTASRQHLNSQYARGVDRLLWDLDRQPMPGADAVRAVIAASRAGERRDALGIGAALVLVQALARARRRARQTADRAAEPVTLG